MDKAYKAVQQLVKDFSNNETAYLAPNYQESRVRQDFVDKFFAALGWDVTHERQKNPYEQEVKIENRVQTGGSQRRADYAFFITPNFRDVKFFVEAKKPAHDLKKHDYYHQAIRYGWNQGTPLAVLTDFEEFHILDCRYKPNIETALEHSVKVYRYKDYADKEKFSEIFFLFGRDAVADGSLEKFAATLPKPRGKAIQKGLFKGGYQPVDEAFLEELDGYRETLAKAFKKENQKLEGEELTEAVQRTIDRLVFIRFLEDKQIEEPAIINYREKKSAWGAFLAHCRSLEPKYNGLVFKPHRILDGKEFNPPDDNHFADICDELADPSSPYDFNHIPISILGSIYERFLGKVVKATDHQAKIQDKPEVRKAGGVYYTPEYIVRYIVNETVGKLIEGKTPDEIAQMAFADIACGSGSFLIEVYSRLLEYHARYYAERPKAAHKEDIAKREGKTALTLKKRQEILLNNIYGVDIDFQATEVTQLSLYLKLLEDATTNDAYQFGLLKEKILPDLRNNIICGNSLIGTDILEGDLFGREEDKKLNPMNFADAFPKIMKRGGFDAVVGNPPYVRIQGFPRKQILYFTSHYQSAQGNYDSYVNFVEQGFKLISQQGKFGMILPNKFFKTDYGEGLRELIAGKKAVYKIIDFGANQVFDATTYTCLLFLTKSSNEKFLYSVSPATQNSITSLDFESKNAEALNKEPWLFVNQNEQALLSKLSKNSIRLLDLPSDMSRGSSSGDDEVFVFSRNSLNVEKEILRLPVFASDFGRYSFHISREWRIIFPYFLDNASYRIYTEKELKKKFPKAYNYLYSHKARLKKRKQYTEWYGYSAPRNLQLHDYAQIIVPLLADKGLFGLIPEELQGKLCPMASGGFTITISNSSVFRPEYVLGLLNSKLIFWKLQKESNVFRGGWITCTKQYFGELPIRTINFSDPEDKARHDRIVKLVEQMLAAKEQRAGAKTEKDENKLDLHIAALDRQIDEAVYELYGLTEEEVKVVEQ